MAVRLEKALGSTADTWLRMQMNYGHDRAGDRHPPENATPA
jgi:plasmid maintenance system antidote protein VapI